MRISLGALALADLLFNVVMANAGAPNIVTLPAHVRWCTPISVSEKDAHNDELQRVERKRAVEVLDSELKRNNRERSGMPYVAGVTFGSATTAEGLGNIVRMKICYEVDPKIDPPAGAIESQALMAERVAVTLCPKDQPTQCLRGLQEWLAVTEKKPISVVEQWPWRLHPVDSKVDASRYPDMIVSIDARPLFGDYSISEYGVVPKPPDPKVFRSLEMTKQGEVISVGKEQDDAFLAVVLLGS